MVPSIGKRLVRLWSRRDLSLEFAPGRAKQGVLGVPSLVWSPETWGSCVQNPNPNLGFTTAWLQGFG